jgi:hypothetical protein
MGEIKEYVRLYVENSDILETEANKLSVMLQNNIKREAPYKEGRLKRSIRVDTRIDKKFALITGYWDEGLAPHGIYVLAGTKPHPITFTNRWGTKTTVQHPGTKANDFLGRGLLRTLEAYK